MRVRDLVWRAGTPVRTGLIAAIGLYRIVLSGWLGGQCRFFPSCSHYAQSAIREHGAVRGTGLALWRIARCNPYGRGGLEPVPLPRHRAAKYEDVLQNAGRKNAAQKARA